MIPSVPQVLNGIARTLLMELLPQAGDAYLAQTLQLEAGLIMCCAQEFDRAAARLADENAAVTAILREAAALVEEPDLREKLRSHADLDAPGLLVSALHERNRLLRTLLIDLHAHVEQLASPTARAMNERIWEELVASTRRRQLDLAMPS